MSNMTHREVVSLRNPKKDTQKPAQSIPQPGGRPPSITGSDRTDLDIHVAICLNSLVAVGGSRVVGTISGGGCSTDLLALELKVLLVVVVDVQTKSGRVNVAVTPDEKSTKDRLSQHIEDTVKDGLGVGRNVVATLTKAPSDGVKRPQKRGQGTTLEESSADILAHGTCVLASFPGELVDDVEQRSAAKRKVAPLVAGSDEGACETSDDHDLVNEDSEENGRPGHASGEEQVGEQKRSGDDPVDVANCGKSACCQRHRLKIAAHHKRSRGKDQQP